MDKKPARNLTACLAAIAGAVVNNSNGGKLPGLSRKLFQKAPSEHKKNALTEVKSGGNTRALAMVLRGEWVDEIAALRLQFEQKDIEVERLKDLCLWQREEIWTLKGAVFFPATQPDHNLTGQIQYLAEKIAVVKTKKHMPRSCMF
ncbi:uncharacterized protein [Oryza sativa Japonica Group]|uniref:Os05g0547100 protein n=2 Tax=Oryza sativa subsp. japonica TaxID=39947 RepID=A0A0P0WQ79_ORYSJ|nr:uncharacterized protein LOC4339506 isoform X1 [Oryza sativa Japonica Group]KAF2931942.1 hypothetical protein DAI22_05g248600 [Oryza sativa Japonica Group]BAF18135.1 Os05g0547100 [Oryza sativa Japonica Group]BAS95175.1 Os05g0547100 [Oryza sativa Japonica Group]|eukprot:NP_001056221.1 Os05g0547100 [Oryza sativa Japonica Group]